MRSYETARSLFSFLAFCAWSTVGIGVVAAFVGAGSVSRYGDSGAAFLAMMPGIGISLIALFQVAVIQNARATVDTAEYTQQMLKISRDQLEVSKQSLQQGFAFQQSYTALNKETGEAIFPTEQPQKHISNLIEHSGKMIEPSGEKFMFNGIPFSTLNGAKSYIDKFVSAPSKPLPRVTRS